VKPRLTVSAELLYGTTESPAGRLDWTGYALIVSHELAERWRLFTQWSDLEDVDGFITGSAAHGQQISIGLAYYLHRLVEARFEYRHNISRPISGAATTETDEVSAHLTFGY
jgi:hypothetical protein